MTTEFNLISSDSTKKQSNDSKWFIAPTWLVLEERRYNTNGRRLRLKKKQQMELNPALELSPISRHLFRSRLVGLSCISESSLKKTSMCFLTPVRRGSCPASWLTVNPALLLSAPASTRTPPRPNAAGIIGVKFSFSPLRRSAHSQSSTFSLPRLLLLPLMDCGRSD